MGCSELWWLSDSFIIQEDATTKTSCLLQARGFINNVHGYYSTNRQVTNTEC